MSGKKKAQETMSASGDDLLEALSKDEKEAMLNRKMQEIRRKNEERQRRHALIEADRKRAEQEGSAVSLKAPPPQEQSEQVLHEPVKMRGVRIAVTEGEKKSPFVVGRGRRLANMKQEANKTQESQQSGGRKPRPKSQIFDDKSQVQQEKSKRPKSQCFDMPPDVSSGGFLYDDSRQGPLPENMRNKSSRNRASYGGDDFSNVRKQMQYEKQRTGWQQQDPQGKAPLELTMTGKERRQYQSWKEERERIDAQRMQRAQREPGAWKREWDVDKRVEDPVPPPSRHMEPGKRPAGRIGSGRFTQTEERVATEVLPVTGGSRGGPSGRGGGRYQHRSELAASQELSPRQRQDSDGRHVDEQNDSLVIQVVNDFSGQGLDGRWRGRGTRGRGRGEWDAYRGERGGRGFYRGGGPERGGMGPEGRGGYRGGRGAPYRGRGNFYSGPEDSTRGRRKKGWAEWEAEQAQREALRTGAQITREPLDTEILGRAIIVTTSTSRGPRSDAKPSDTQNTPGAAQDSGKGEKFSPNKLSGQSGDSWDTLGTEESWETVGDGEELVEEGDEGERVEELEDQYAEDDYWEESLQLHGGQNHDLQFESELSELDPGLDLVSTSELNESLQKQENIPDSVETGEGVMDALDIHNSSAESLDRFIQEHTLHLDISTGNLEAGRAKLENSEVSVEKGANITVDTNSEDLKTDVCTEHEGNSSQHPDTQKTDACEQNGNQAVLNSTDAIGNSNTEGERVDIL